MKYIDYLNCAKKHLESCNSLFSSYKKNEPSVWLELYYLSGYIMEGIVIYAVYKHYGWDENKDIQTSYDVEFTNRTKLDYYKNRIKYNCTYNKYVFPGRNKETFYCVQGHNFKNIVDDLLRKDLSVGSSSIPYIGSRDIVDKDVCALIDEWRPDIRYWLSHQKLNRDVINQ